MFNRFLNGSEPPDNIARKVTECTACGEDICEGDTYFHIPDTNENYCASCMRDFEAVAEIDDGKDDNDDVEYRERLICRGMPPMNSNIHHGGPIK